MAPRKPPRACARCGEPKVLRSSDRKYCDDCKPLVKLNYDPEEMARRARIGNAKRTPEQREANAKWCRKMVADRVARFPKPLPEWVEKQTAALRALTFDSAEMARRAKIGWQIKVRRRGTMTPEQLEEMRAWMSQPKSEETRRRMSKWASEHRDEMAARASGPKTPEWRLGQAERVRKGISGFRMAKKQTFTCRLGRSFRMRSGWEVAMATWLDARGYDWDYEPVAIRLPSGAAYLPDFLLKDGRFLEVKGHCDPKSLNKVKEARSMGLVVLLLVEEALRRLGVLKPRRKRCKANPTGSTKTMQPATSTIPE